VPRRSVVIEGYLFTISDLGLMVTHLADWSTVRTINLPWQGFNFETDA